MILEPAPDALKHMFLRGFRAPAGGTADPDPVAEEVGVLVARQIIGTNGYPREVEKVLDQDTPFDPPNSATGPFRFEAELATTKPELDVVIVDDLRDVLTNADFAAIGLAGPADLEGLTDPDRLDQLAGLIADKPFGNIRIDAGSGFGPPITRNYGWLRRSASPRVEKAGRAGPETDPASLEGFDPERFKLPAKYFNAFNAGNPVPGRLPLSSGHRLRFEDGGVNPPEVTIPAGPSLTVSRNGQPLDPQPVLTPLVDTVVYDRADASVTLTWRAVFAWDARYEGATLEIM